MTFFDFVAGVAIGSIGADIMFNREVPFWTMLLGLSSFSALALASDFLSLKSILGRKLLDSEPIVIIREGKILERGMAKSRLTMDTLLALLRKKDVFYVDEVQMAYFEVDGTLSVQRKTPMQPATLSDLGAERPDRGRAQAVVIDGKLLKDSLSEAGRDAAWLEEELRRANADLKDVALLQVELGAVYIDLKRDMIS